MIIVNTSHPVSDAQLAALESATGVAVMRVIDVATHFDNALPFGRVSGGERRSCEHGMVAGSDHGEPAFVTA